MKAQAIDVEALDLADRGFLPGQPVYMLNLLRFRPQALYGNGSGEPSCTGREAYFERYIPAFRRLAGGRAPTRVFAGRVLAKLVGPEGARWDMAAVNEYADIGAFRAIVDSPAYRVEAEPHRLAALEQFRMFAMDKVV